MATNFEPHKCVIFVKSTKIGTHKNKAIHSSVAIIVPVFLQEGPLNLFLCYMYLSPQQTMLQWTESHENLTGCIKGYPFPKKKELLV